MKIRKLYAAPSLYCIEVTVEKGIAASLPGATPGATGNVYYEYDDDDFIF